jgi:HEAT repeat protein
VARSIEQQVADLRALDPTQSAGLAKLRTALRGANGFVIAAAAKIVEDRCVTELVGELAGAFARLSGDDAVKCDPACRGKMAIARALHGLDRWDDAVFVAGLGCVQLEGFGRDDTAAELRGVCGIAHAHFGRPDALDVLAGLLADRERSTRLAAAQALGDAGRPDATALLRFKILLGDDEPAVLSACFEALFALAREASYDFVVARLAGHDDRAEVAALALGGARFAEAVEPLIGWCVGASPEQRHRIGFLALALLRAEPATAHLLDAVRSHGRRDAIAAARALATFKDDPALVERIRAAATDQRDAAARTEIAELLA